MICQDVEFKMLFDNYTQIFNQHPVCLSVLIIKIIKLKKIMKGRGKLTEVLASACTKFFREFWTKKSPQGRIYAFASADRGKNGKGLV